MANLTAREKVEAQLQKARAALAKVKHHATAAVPQVVSGLEVFGGNVGGGFIDERFGTVDEHGIREHKVGGFPTNLGIGAGLAIAAGAGIAGEHSHHVWDVSKGFFSSWGNTLGRVLGAEARKESETKK